MRPAGRAPLQFLFPGWYALGLAGLPRWAVSFPLAALAALSLRLADESLAMRAFGLARTRGCGHAAGRACYDPSPYLTVRSCEWDR